MPAVKIYVTIIAKKEKNRKTFLLLRPTMRCGHPNIHANLFLTN
jgi:hypothetical protein